MREPDFSQLFHATESYRGGADGQEKTINLLRAMGSLLEDLLLMLAGTPGLIRNLDLSADLERMAQGLTVEWIAALPARLCRWNRECGAICCARSRWMRWRLGCRNVNATLQPIRVKKGNLDPCTGHLLK